VAGRTVCMKPFERLIDRIFQPRCKSSVQITGGHFALCYVECCVVVNRKQDHQSSIGITCQSPLCMYRSALGRMQGPEEHTSRFEGREVLGGVSQGFSCIFHAQDGLS